VRNDWDGEKGFVGMRHKVGYVERVDGHLRRQGW
jgi:hypothetical protein